MALGSDAGIRFRDGGLLSKEFIFEVGGEPWRAFPLC